MERHRTVARPLGPLNRSLSRAHHRPAALALRAGLFIITIGALLDIAHHAGVPGLTAEAAATAGHLLTLAGMLLTAAGVALAATPRRR